MTVAGPACPECGTPAGRGDRFCEQCGADLPAEAPSGPSPAPSSTPASERSTCSECGGRVDVDGYCTVCGAKAPPARDHLVVAPQPWVAGVTDRGRRHPRNEDAVAVLADADGGAALVVCDGVSASEDSDVASLAAARAAAEEIGTGPLGPAPGGTVAGALRTRVGAAASAASSAVAAAGSAHEGSPPSCTLVAAAVRGSVVVVGSVGDSRAYWLPDTGDPELLTEDDSVAGEQIAAGRSRAEAESGPQAHAITRWIGVDSPDESPRLVTLHVSAPGWLLLCSDGLWNYCSEATAVAAVLREALTGAGDDPLASATSMVSWANAQGGHDNITVVLARLGGPGPPGREGEVDEG